MALIENFENELLQAVQSAVSDVRAKDLPSSLRLVVRAIVRVHQRRASLNRILELEEDRLQQYSVNNADHHLQPAMNMLLRRYRDQLSVPLNEATVHDFITITRAMVDSALLRYTHPAFAERRILHALCGYLLWS